VTVDPGAEFQIYGGPPPAGWEDGVMPRASARTDLDEEMAMRLEGAPAEAWPAFNPTCD